MREQESPPSPAVCETHRAPDASRVPPAASPFVRRRSGAARMRAAKLALLVILVLALALGLWRPWSRSGGVAPSEAAADAPVPVHVAKVVDQDMPVVLTALGSVTPLTTVTVKTQLAGTLQSVFFREGQSVKQGDVLAQIDPRPYELSLANAEGAYAKNVALLDEARVNLTRYRTLLAAHAIAAQQFDAQMSLVKQYEGQVKSDAANVGTFKLDLKYARITAPVSGRLGMRQVDPGNYVTPTDPNGIVVIRQLQPISVVFTTAEDNVSGIVKRMATGARLTTEVYDRDNSTLLETGYLETIDNQIDAATGTVKLRAVFSNAQQTLFPNQFVNARLLVDTVRHALVVPESAVQDGVLGPFVYVVKPDQTVMVRAVKVGTVDHHIASISAGLALGELVVTDGADRLRAGAKVVLPSPADAH
ncbi:efflux RND transporter periplasmic adaptor subunit [Trinickia soli]|uniref:efflux RND transporter periplasmic adaptor subunit n=1 Tax=Trinickia soli TaxID=380675 RepID=UPI003FA3BE2B